MLIGDILSLDTGTEQVLTDSGIHCIGCPASRMESLRDACAVHGIGVSDVLQKLNSHLKQ